MLQEEAVGLEPVCHCMGRSGSIISFWCGNCYQYGLKFCVNTLCVMLVYIVPTSASLCAQSDLKMSVACSNTSCSIHHSPVTDVMQSKIAKNDNKSDARLAVFGVSFELLCLFYNCWYVV